MSTGRLLDVEGHDEVRRRVLWSLPNVLGVLGTVDRHGAPHLMNISWVTPVANTPTRLVVSVESQSRSAANLREVTAWTLSLLTEELRAAGRAFVKPTLAWSDDFSRAQGFVVERTGEGVAYLADAVGVLAGSTATPLVALGEHDVWLLSVDAVAAHDSLLEGPASNHSVPVLTVQQTRMNYGR